MFLDERRKYHRGIEVPLVRSHCILLSDTRVSTSARYSELLITSIIFQYVLLVIAFEYECPVVVGKAHQGPEHGPEVYILLAQTAFANAVPSCANSIATSNRIDRSRYDLQEPVDTYLPGSLQLKYSLLLSTSAAQAYSLTRLRHSIRSRSW